MRRKSIITTLLSIIFILLTMPSGAQGAQNRQEQRMTYRDFALQGPRIELGFSLATANAMTDVAASQAHEQSSLFDIYSRGFMPAVSVYGRYRFRQSYALKGKFSGIMLKGDDRWSHDLDVVNRGKSFKNNVLEFALINEFYLPKRISSLKNDFRFSWIDFYLFVGFSVFHHSPEVKGPILDDYDANIYEDPDIYDNWQVGVPFGAGMKLLVRNSWTIGLDFNFRYTFFDYLDGFRRPYSKRNDFFFTTGINVGFILDNSSRRNNRPISRNVFDIRRKSTH